MACLKKISFSIILFCGIAATCFSQTLKEVFTDSESPLTYLGINFSKSKLVDNGNASEIRDRLYGAINQVIMSEPKKYDLKAAFRKSNVNSDLTAVTKVNATANLNDILSMNTADFNRFSAADITPMVKQLDLSGKSGVGVLFVMEAMRKLDKKGSAAVWVTFIDMKSKKVLLTERMESKASMAIGFRNYWGSAIKNLIDDIEKKKYKEWQGKYGS